MARATEIVVFFLSVWRLSKMITEEEGPGMIFSQLREISGAEYNGFPEQWDNLTWYGKLTQCPYCISVWISLLLYLVYIVNRNVFWAVTMTLSGSAATVLIEDYNGNRNS